MKTITGILGLFCLMGQLLAMDGFEPPYPYGELIQDAFVGNESVFFPGISKTRMKPFAFEAKEEYYPSYWTSSASYANGSIASDVKISYDEDFRDLYGVAMGWNQFIAARACRWEHKPNSSIYAFGGKADHGILKLSHQSIYWDYAGLLEQSLRMELLANPWGVELNGNLQHEDKFDFAGKGFLSRDLGPVVFSAGASWFDHARPCGRIMVGRENICLLKVEYADDWQTYPLDKIYRDDAFYWKSLEISKHRDDSPLPVHGGKASLDLAYGEWSLTLSGDARQGCERYDARWTGNAYTLYKNRAEWHQSRFSLDSRLFGLHVQMAYTEGDLTDFDSRFEGGLECEGRILPLFDVSAGFQYEGRTQVAHHEFNRYVPYGGISFYGIPATKLSLNTRFPASDWQGNTIRDGCELSLTLNYGRW